MKTNPPILKHTVRDMQLNYDHDDHDDHQLSYMAILPRQESFQARCLAGKRRHQKPADITKLRVAGVMRSTGIGQVYDVIPRNSLHLHRDCMDDPVYDWREQTSRDIVLP